MHRCVGSEVRPRSINLAYFKDVTGRFGLASRSALVSEADQCSVGLSWQDLVRVADAADLLVNISGHLALATLKSRFRKRVFIDLDPGYTQHWHRAGLAEDKLQDHGYYFTVGENVGRPGCTVLTSDIPWRPIRQPVVLDEWPVSTDAAHPRFTTVASWRGPYGRVTHGRPRAHSG